MIQYKKTSKKNSPVGDFEMAQLVIKDTISIKDIALKIEKEVGIPSIRSMSVLTAMVEMVGGMIAEGNTVNLEGLGFLKAGLSMEDGKPTIKRVVFTPSVQLKKSLKEVTFKEIKD